MILITNIAAYQLEKDDFAWGLRNAGIILNNKVTFQKINWIVNMNLQI